MSQDVIAMLRQSSIDCQYATVHGMKVDTTTANALLTVYDALNVKNQEKFAGFVNSGRDGLMKMVDFSWKQVR